MAVVPSACLWLPASDTCASSTNSVTVLAEASVHVPRHSGTGFPRAMRATFSAKHGSSPGSDSVSELSSALTRLDIARAVGVPGCAVARLRVRQHRPAACPGDRALPQQHHKPFKQEQHPRTNLHAAYPMRPACDLPATPAQSTCCARSTTALVTT